MDVGLLSRIQFAITIGFHFLFPPITIGLAWLLVVVEYKAWKSGKSVYDRMGRFYGKILGLTFAVGVATGIPMEFQFGTNWARYSKFVGDIFGAPLAAEAVLAFFLESGFLGLYLFGRKRVSTRMHVFSILMVAVGATLSAFWILVADSWMQTPAGFVIHNGRAELTSFYDAVFNPSTLPRIAHTVTAALVCGSFFMAGIAAYLLRRDPDDDLARRALKIAITAGLTTSVLVAFPFGHEHARQVARTQPEKFAAIEGLYSTQGQAPLVFFAIPFTKPPELKARVEVPGFLSLLAFGNVHAEVKGIEEFPKENIPPLWMTFVSFHNMVVLGLYFMIVMAVAAWKWRTGGLWISRKFLLLLICSIPLPLMACQLGWIAAEVGRQPWIVYHQMRTADAFSATVSAGEVLFSIILFSLIYLVLGVLYIYLLAKKVKHDPPGELMTEEPATMSEDQTVDALLRKECKTMTLQTIWFILIFVLLGGYAILDGFDLGVGVLHLFTRDERERRISINAIGPVWDGNEVWLLAGGGALFAAFPPVYATVFSGFYLALMLLLAAFICRAVAMEFRGKVDSPKWRRVWDWVFGIGSLLPPVLLGTALGNVLRGVPLDENGNFAGSFLGLLNPYSVLVGVFALILFTTHGAMYLANKSDGPQRARVLALAKPLWIGLVVVHMAAGICTLQITPDVMTSALERPLLFWPLMALLSAALIYLPITAFTKAADYRRAFVASSCIIAAMVSLTAVGLFPLLLRCSSNPNRSLNVMNASSTQRTLGTMLVIALVGMPLVIGYTAVIYRVFRGKVVLSEESY